MKEDVIKALEKGGVVVLPTDTIYGIHCLALSRIAVNNLYNLKKRYPTKPFIILISSIKQLSLFGIKIENNTKQILSTYWPGMVSIVLPCKLTKFKYLHRKTNSLAFRLPNKRWLVDLIDKTGPLVSTSVNVEGETPATTIKEAREYFGDKIKVYVDEGPLESHASTVIKIINTKVVVLREGSTKITS